MRRIRFAGLVVLASLGLGVGSASARQIVTFGAFVPESEDGHGWEVLQIGRLVGLEVSQFEINTSHGSTDCRASFLTTLLSNQQPTDELRIDGGSTEQCESDGASAQIYFQKLPWWLAVSANHTATLTGASLTLAYVGGPTCLYRAPSTTGVFQGPLGFLSITSLLQLIPTREAGCSPWARLTAIAWEIAVSAPYANAIIENAPPFVSSGFA